MMNKNPIRNNFHRMIIDYCYYELTGNRKIMRKDPV